MRNILRFCGYRCRDSDIAPTRRTGPERMSPSQFAAPHRR